MGILDRVILTLYTFCLTLLSLMIMVAALGWQQVPLALLEDALTNPNGRLALGVTAGVFFIVSVRLLYFGFSRRRSHMVVHTTGLGDVSVALDAIESLIRRVCRQLPGVRDVRAAVSAPPAGLVVRLRLSVTPDVSVPTFSDEVQSEVKNQIQTVVGADVHEIRIVVDSIGDEGRRPRLD